MYNVSQNFKNTIMSTSRILKAKVLINSREYDESYIVEMNYEDTSNPSGSFEIGTVASAILNLSIVGVNEAFETATIKPYIGLDLNGTVEYVPLGVFYCDRVERKKDVVTLTCYDGMIKLDKAYFSNLTYPATISAVMNEICTKAGIQFTGTLPNYSFSKKPEGYKFREVVAFIAQMCGGFAKFDRDGKLRIKSYTTTSETITADHYMDDGFSKKKDAVFRIDKITCQVGENTISKGTLSAGGSEVQFENPFMTDAIMTDVYNKLKGFQYLPVYLKFVGNPAYEVGDIVTLVTVDDEIIQIPIMVNKLAFFGGLTGEIESVGETENSNQFDSSGSLTNKVERVVYELAFINEALINKATIEDLEATNARIDDLIANDLTAINAQIENLIANKANISDLEAINAEIENLRVEKADIEDLDAINARIDNLEVTKANITDLDAVNAAIQNLQADKADITDLNATNARIDNLVTNDLTAINAEITNLKSGKADIADLNAVNATIATLQADVGSINTLLAGNLGAENFRAGAIYAGSGVIAQGAIGDAEISNLNASKINAGILNTALVTIQGANGRMKIANNRLQVFANKTDGSLYERVSLGDVNGDGSVYGLRVRGADGQTVLLDENGVKREGITDGSITNEKIADDANISGTKLDIASVVTEINEGTTTIKSSKVFLDGSTLDIQFSSMKNTVTAQGQTITNHETRIMATEQELSTKVSISQYQQDQAALSSQLSQMSTQIQQQANQIALKADAANVYTKSQIDGQFTTVNTQISNLSAQLTVQADQIATKVSKTEFESLQIGGRNLYKSSDNIPIINVETGITYQKISDGIYKNVWKFTKADTSSANYIRINDSNLVNLLEPDKEFTISIMAKGTPRTGLAPILRFYFNSSTNYKDMSPQVGSNYTWVSFTFKTSNVTPTMHIGMINFKELYIALIKIERGNKPTDWTPAPEDVDAQIDGLGSRMTTAETSISQLSNQIALKANQSTVDNLTNQVTSLSAQLTVQADQIATKVSRTEFESLQIGGRNLAKNSTGDLGLDGWETFNSGGSLAVEDGYGGHKAITRSITASGGAIYTPLADVIPNETYTLSFWVKTDKNATVGHLLKFKDTNNNETNPIPLETQSISANTWVRIIFTFTVPANQIKVATTPRVTAGSFPVKLWVSQYKIEAGNRATDWTPAPEDVQGQIDGLGSRMTTAETSITQLSNQIALKANQSTVDNLTNQVTSLSAQLSVQAGQIATKVEKNGVISAINQTAESIKIQASKVDLAGYVTFTNLSTPGQTTIDGGNLKTGSVTTDKIAAKAITADKLNVTSLSAISADLGTVTAGTLKGVKLEGALIDATTGLTVYHLSISANRYPNLAIYGEPNTGAFTIRTTDGIDSAHSTSLNIVADGNLRLGGSYGTIETETVFVQSPMDMDGNDIDNVNYLYAKYGRFNSTIEFSDAKGRLFTDTGANVGYLQTTGKEYRVTKYKSTTYIPVRASSFPTGSLAEFKEDIHPWADSALEKIRQATIYEYYLKSELEQGVYRKRQGLVIGEGYNTPGGVIDGDGVEQYLMNAWSWKAIQELDSEQQSMKDRIAWLELENQYLKQKIQQLEGMIS